LPTLQDGLKVEEECFLEALTSPAGMAQRHVFFAVRQAQKPVYKNEAADVKNHVLLQKQPPSSSTVIVQTAVIGAGTMGCGIAMVLLKAGFAVTLVDVAPSALDKGMKMIHQTLARKSKQGGNKATTTLLAALQNNLHCTTKLDDLSHCQLVVEAVVEKLHIKQSIFATLDRVTPPDAILLSNTSTLDIDAMARALSSHARRANFAGWHFFSPAHVMQLVEIVVGTDTSPHTVALLQALSKKVGKIAVVVGNCDGFCGNRLLRPYSLEMVSVLTEGAARIDQIDAAVSEDLGMALGPFAMADLAGNDIGYSIRVERQWARGGSRDGGGKSSTTNTPINRPARYSELADVMVTDYRRLGQKTGKGWYDYDPTIGKGRTPLPSAEMQSLVERYITVPPAVRARLSSQEIIQRIIFPLVNEGFKCLEEGIVQRPSDIDVVYIYGYGWPAWRGGPMYWADHDVGLPRLLQVLRMLSRQFPDTPHYVPSRLLEDCVARQLTVEEYYRQGLDQHLVKRKNKTTQLPSSSRL
jgi:3-hydroxyacyl-CoA dehydrogenase